MKVLVVDDEKVTRMALIDAIAECGNYRIAEASNGEEAWQQISGQAVPPMMVCCDIRMPGMSGLDLLQKVRAHPGCKDLPFVLVSMVNEAAAIQEAVQLGVSGYLVKPFSQQDARNRLSKLLLLAASKTMERPALTMARLKLPQDRYRAYLSGLQNQIGQLLAELAEGAGPKAPVSSGLRQKLNSLKANCATLGLWRAQQLLSRDTSEEGSSGLVSEYLGEIRQQLHQQLFSQD
ncbi:response regulator transcription factor [Paucibacter sp. Y2R2-4]|uniref:response regulator transcription factor n=1 Tax=Paucibacter sp. Y2R2-4 TaxID=2893553 RepID=UPI0021E410BE|nr:response regulator [Paucibacter sp. Y2R2-4]MCV2352105.1 response regulator [Paucibacter sp. Y2R2-4]